MDVYKKDFMNFSKLKDKAVCSDNGGFSMIELLVVMALVMIMSGTVFYYLNATQTLYNADEQALKISDILQEARQRSLTQRETMRVEIDLTDSVVRLIDENDATTVNDDSLVRTLPIKSEAVVRIDERPGQISNNPPEEFPVPSAQYRQSIYPVSLAHDVCTLRFLSNGTVVDQGTNEIGTNAVSTGTTLHVWTPDSENVRNSQIARSLTIIGSTGSIRFWEYDPSLTTNNKWKDTRTTSVYGGQGDAGDNSNSNK